MRLTEPREDFSRQHQDVRPKDGKPYGDLPDYADFDYSAKVGRVVVATLFELASAPPPTTAKTTKPAVPAPLSKAEALRGRCVVDYAKFDAIDPDCD